MKRTISILALLLISYAAAQEKPVEKIYFAFDKHNLNKEQVKNIVTFIQNIDTNLVESIQIYGYCDDRGTNDYNYKLSQKRVQTVRNIITKTGFNERKIIIFEGKGRVLLEKAEVENLNGKRSKNRRVDLLIVKKSSRGNGIYSSFQDKHQVGDRIYLQNISFQLGSSELTFQAQLELDKIVVLLQKQKTLEFEIRGHVCCTSSQHSDAVDKATNTQNLSLNRAKTVYNYLRSNGVNRLRMQYSGKGNKYPLGQGDQMDRRVEFYISKN
jgi:outer membrane protein OmpA-like peptidoglycan-associated protein